jgi:hypothetical protein
MVNLGSVPTPDWNQEFVREQVLQLRHERWRTNSIHILKLTRKLAIAWLLLRHGTDITDAIITVAFELPNLKH